MNTKLLAIGLALVALTAIVPAASAQGNIPPPPGTCGTGLIQKVTCTAQDELQYVCEYLAGNCTRPQI